MEKRLVKLTVNGVAHERAVAPAATLLEVLREELFLTGTKRGCDVGDCGCCTVLLDGAPVLSCLVLALEADGAEIRTIEGVANGNQLHPVQQAFVDHGAIQCGFCTPSMVLNAVHLLDTNPSPDAAAVKTCVSGTICRCTGYTKIEQAVHAAARACTKTP
ncbi:MAG: (2Fe-2S)-binding protein [Myxococcales bacterium]|nr:(2Fe-2S)-binding protein [Myxococcales bacterium]